MTRKDIPNLISILRIVLILPFVWALSSQQFFLALLLFAIAGISDGIDGFLAKHFHWQSRLGSILDPIADKLLLIASFATLTWLTVFPLWLLVLVIARDLVIVAGGLAYHYRFGEFELLPLWSSKINTALQITLVLVAMIQQYWLPSWDMIVTIGIWLVVASIIHSGTEYILVWGRKAWKQSKAEK